jgi:hypothetical protein
MIQKLLQLLIEKQFIVLVKMNFIIIFFFFTILILFQGTNGFEELCLLDSGFEEFERVLFSDTSLTFERSIQTKEINDSLNQTIRRFLIRLSPYFLLSPAHKALEWLVHR